MLNLDNLRTVLTSEGTADILAGKTADAVETNLESVASEIRSYTTNTPTRTRPTSSLPPRPAARLPPRRKAPGSRQPGHLPSPSTGIYLAGFVDGCVDFASSTGGTGTSSTVAAADLTSRGSPNDAYYQAEANAYLNSTTLSVEPDIILGPRAMH